MLLARDRVLLVATLLVAITAVAAWTNSTRDGGSFRIQLQQRNAAHKFASECFLSRHGDNLEFTGNRTVYRLTTGEQERRVARDAEGRRLACRHALRPRKYFTGTLRIGTPPQQFEMLFDTGSDIVWVAHSKCRLNGRQWATNSEKGKFAIDRSTSFKRIGRERTSVVYGNNMRFSGWWVEDIVQLADARDSARSLAVANQPIALICFIDGPEDPFAPEFDGIVGLSFPVSNREGSNKLTLLDNLLAQSLLDEPVFSFYTDRSAKSSPQLSTGELIFGQLDKSRYIGPITWTPVVRLPHWEIRAHSIRLLDHRAPRTGPSSPRAFACTHGCEVIVDTGTDLIFGPDKEVAYLNEQQLGFVRNEITPDIWFKMGACRQHTPSLPLSFVVQVGATHLELKPEAFLLDEESMDGQKLCMSALRSFGPQASGLGAEWLLGSIFLRDFYTIFDYGQKRVGFATPV